MDHSTFTDYRKITNLLNLNQMEKINDNGILVGWFRRRENRNPRRNSDLRISSGFETVISDPDDV